MNKSIVSKAELSAHELALINNDLSKLTREERSVLYNNTCQSLGLNPLTQPFGYIEFRGGKLSLYAKKDCTDQLRKIHGVSIDIVSKETIGDNFVVMAKAKDSSDRYDEDMGAVSIKGLQGEMLGNAMMKAITKAKRRVTLSICGLGILDESETETINDAKIKDVSSIKEPVKLAEPSQKDVTPKKMTEELKDIFDLPKDDFPKETITEAPRPEEKPPVINHAIQKPKENIGWPKEEISWKDYKTTFRWGSFPEGMTFQKLGPKDTQSLINAIKSFKLKKDIKYNPHLDEFVIIANQYLESLK